ncbi:hypothetical protein LRP88_08806 [Fusarium phalaenopsidis]
MVVMSSQNSVTESEGRYLEDGYWKHGRFYGSWKPGKYLFPIDSEELNRLDIFHKVFLVARGNKPFHCPIMRKTPRIMDLGTGTGIWAINVAEDCLSDAQIMAVDLNQIQPALHLTPGLGHLEHVEIDWTPRWDDDERPSNSSFTQWAELFLTGMDQFNRTARVAPEETRQMLEAAGFTDIKQEIIPAFVCPWSPDRREREIARWFNLGLSHSLESLSLMPLVEKHRLGPDEVRELCARVKREICILRYHTYCNIPNTRHAMLLSGNDDNIKCQADRRDALRSWNCSLAQARP